MHLRGERAQKTGDISLRYQTVQLMTLQVHNEVDLNQTVQAQ